MPDIPERPPPDNKQVFVALCEARALLWQTNEISLQEAVDWLQTYAVRTGLVLELGQDEVQHLMAQAFQQVRDD